MVQCAASAVCIDGPAPIAARESNPTHWQRQEQFTKRRTPWLTAAVFARWVEAGSAEFHNYRLSACSAPLAVSTQRRGDLKTAETERALRQKQKHTAA